MDNEHGPREQGDGVNGNPREEERENDEESETGGREQPRLSSEDEEDSRIQKWASMFKTEGVKLFTGEHSKDDNLKSILDEVLTTAELWFDTARVTSDRGRHFLLVQLLKGRARECVRNLVKSYRAKADAEGGPRIPPYDEIVSTLKKLTVRTAKSPIQLDQEIKETTLIGLATEGSIVLPLVTAFDKLKRLIEKRAMPFDSLSLISIYLNACPPEIAQKVKHVTQPDGRVEDASDPVMLENNILGYSEDFEALARKAKNRSGGGSDGGNRVTPKPHNQNNRHGAKRRRDDRSGPPSSPQKNFKRPSLPPFLRDLPESAKKLEYKKGMHFYVHNLLPEERIRLMAAGKCCICKEKGHMLNDCPKRDAMFKADPKEYFSYHPRK